MEKNLNHLTITPKEIEATQRAKLTQYLVALNKELSELKARLNGGKEETYEDLILEKKEEIQNYKIQLEILDRVLGDVKDKKIAPNGEDIKNKRIKATEEAVNKLIDSILKNEEQKTAVDIINILKTEKISQIVLHSKENLQQAEKYGLSLKKDLDTTVTVELLKMSKIEYSDDAVSSFLPKGGHLNDIEEDAQRKGVRLIIDNGGKWMTTERENGEIKNVYIDHHGPGLKNPTSATELLYKILKKGDLFKEKPSKEIEGFINFVTEYDNLSCLDKKNEKGEKIYNENYFKENWAKTPYSLADIIPEKLFKSYLNGEIKDLSVPLSLEEIKKIGGEELIDQIAKKEKEINGTINGIENSTRNNKKLGLDLENTRIGKIIFHDYPTIKPQKGKEFTNIIKNNLAFLGTKMLGYDSYVCWNEKDKTFFINSKNENLEEIISELNKEYPGSIVKDIRGEMVLGKITNFSKEDFLRTLDSRILKKGATSI